MSQFEVISKFGNDSIRAAMKRYYDHIFDGSEKQSYMSVSTLVLLNRYLFAVPEWLEREELDRFPFYFSISVPEEGNKVNLLWPLGQSKSGDLTLISAFAMGSGPPPDPLGEFDVFLERFGRRK